MQTDLTRNVTGPLKLLVRLTSFAAETPLECADTAIWLAASPDVEGVSGRFWSKRRELRCKFHDSAEIPELLAMIEDQLGAALAAA